MKVISAWATKMKVALRRRLTGLQALSDQSSDLPSFGPPGCDILAEEGSFSKISCREQQQLATATLILAQ